ncbi:MAG: TIGR01777 family oxidoreductase [Kiritimatiellia bacterium]|nr:TIGR01777 family oxidoreductase [Kiritimatiellia bacterium]
MIAITGTHGLLASALIPVLTRSGHRVIRLVRRKPAGPDEVFWNPESDAPGLDSLEGATAVIHLAGESLAGGRWTPDRMRRIDSSRGEATLRLTTALARLRNPPEVFLCASATGYYGDRGDRMLDESSPTGRGFLAGVCQRWEAACEPLNERSVRVVRMRLGPVLSPLGGILARLIPVFRWGLGGPLGSGRQIMSWISLPDVTRAILHILRTESIAGPVNLTSPHPISNAEFTLALAAALRRPAWIPLPAGLLRLALGKMADEALLASARVHPRVLLDSGFQFHHPRMEDAVSRRGSYKAGASLDPNGSRC